MFHTSYHKHHLLCKILVPKPAYKGIVYGIISMIWIMKTIHAWLIGNIGRNGRFRRLVPYIDINVMLIVSVLLTSNHMRLQGMHARFQNPPD